MRYRVHIVAVHSIAYPYTQGNVMPIKGAEDRDGLGRSVVVETNVVVEGYDEAVQVLNDGSDPDASGGVRDFVVSACISMEPD